MISKRSLPARPPIPSRKSAPISTKHVSPPENQDTTASIRKLEVFSIRYSRDDANESDEEISIVRKEDEERGERQRQEPLDANDDDAESIVQHGSTSSLFSTISRPFSIKSPTKDFSEASSFDENPPLESDVDAVHARETETEREHISSQPQLQGYALDGRSGIIPSERKTESENNSMTSTAILLSSLLKKDDEQRSNFAKRNTGDARQDDRKSEKLYRGNHGSFLSSALLKTSQVVLPFGVANEGKNPMVKNESSFTDVPLHNILLVSIILFLFLMVPTPSFVNGFVFGGFLTFFIVCALMWLLTPEMSDEERYKRDVLEHAKDMENAGKQQQKAYELWELSKPPDLEGWFFKATTYNPSEPVDFSDPGQVTPVYGSISGHTLTLQFPKKDELPKIKRSTMLEPNNKIKFSSSKEYDLNSSGKIELVPKTLIMKRIWAKKYPIYLNVYVKPLSTVEGNNTESNQETFELPSTTEEMYLFSSTGRSKEEWYYRMEKLLNPQITSPPPFRDAESTLNPHTSFPRYMAELIDVDKEPSSEAQLTWVNALLGRLFWDVWKSDHWNTKVKNRIQNKISKMKLPPFIRYLKVTEMKLGHALPKIQRAHNLLQNNRGIWVDLEVDYEGGIMLTIETMINLEYYLKQLTDQGKGDEEVVLKFSRDESSYSDISSAESDGDESGEDWKQDYHLAPTTTDGQPSSESVSSDGSLSEDNENSDTEVDNERQFGPEQESQGWARKVKNPKGKKILSMLEKVAKSKWVQKAAETKVVQKAVEKFSNLPIILAVEVAKVSGSMAANIPAPPSNRLWLGFRSNPLLSLIARPKLGEHNVRLTHVTDWIEYKLKQEFKAMFVLPNMEDLTIRIMDSGLEEKFPIS